MTTAAVETLAFLTLELQAKGASIDRLRKLVFGASTKKTGQVLDDKPPAVATVRAATAAQQMVVVLPPQIRARGRRPPVTAATAPAPTRTTTATRWSPGSRSCH